MFSPAQRSNFGSHYLGVLAKLKPGVSLARAQEDLERVTRGIADRHPEEMEGRGVRVQSLQEQLAGNVRMQLFVLSTAVGFVLLIGCVNIASLLVTRAASRRREIAIRSSLGGGQSRIVRQLLTESVVLALAGGLGSLVVASAAIDFLVSNGPITLPRLREAGLQVEVLLFALAVTGLAAILFGLAPAMRAARTDLQSSLRDGGRTAVDRGGRDRLRTAMVVVETAFTVVLLIGTGLLLRSADKLRQVPLGFNPHGVVTARLSLPAARYGSDNLVADAYARMLAPLARHERRWIRRRRKPSSADRERRRLDDDRGRERSDAGRRTEPDGPPRHRRLLRSHRHDDRQRPIASGQRRGGRQPARRRDQRTARRRVVAGRRRRRQAPLDLVRRATTLSGAKSSASSPMLEAPGRRFPAPMELFLPYTQAPEGAWNAFQRSMALVVRSAENWPETYVPAMRQAVRDVDPTVPLYDVRPMENVFVAVTANRRFYLRLVLVLAASGLGLALLGIYGVIAYFVTQRTPEIGLRLAVGAGRGGVSSHGDRPGPARMTALGLAIGVPAALMLTRVDDGRCSSKYEPPTR